MNDKDKVIIRKFDPDLDGSFIFTSWRNSLWFEDHPETDDERTHESYQFFKKANKQIKQTLRDSTVHIACSRIEPEFIYGYSVIQDCTLVWVYVKIDYRRNGIAKLLSKDATKIGEPQTKVGIDVKKRLQSYIEGRRETQREVRGKDPRELSDRDAQA